MNRQSAPVMVIVVLVLILTGLGLVMISSTTAPLADSSGQLKRQSIWFGASILAFGVVGWVDYKKWRTMAWIFFGASVFLLILVFVPGLGSRVKGASRWLNLGPFKIQPSEFLRLTTVLVLAHVLSKHQSKIREWKWGFLCPLGIIAFPLVLLRMEPDLGTMLLLMATTLVMMFIAGSRVWPLMGVGTLGSIAFAVMMWMLPERRARVLAFLNPEEHKEGKFFQIYQGIVAFGSGGTHGRGLGNSRQKMFYIPESTTDSIFPIIGEELGFYFTLAVIIAYALILICSCWIALNSRDSFGTLLGIGLIFGIALQMIINVGTVTGSMPPKGMPLPFVSYGGSNLLISYIAIGLIVSIHRQSLRTKRYSGGMPIDDETPRM
jgi:cell division protein FtsW